MPRVYLDYNATGPPRTVAVDAFREVVAARWGNPSSPHAEGRAARAALETARMQVARLAGDVPASSVFFTSGGTEGAHAALMGAARARRTEARRRVVISGLEHPCVRAAAGSLEGEGFQVEIVPPVADGVIDAQRFQDICLADRTAAAALMVAHNELGTLQPAAAVAAILLGREIPLVVDAVQAVGRVCAPLPALPNVIGVLSAHKLGGLPGAGAVVAHADVRLQAVIGGGGQERGRRGGTPAVGLVAAMGAAAEALVAEGDSERQRQQALRDDFEKRVLDAVEDVAVPGRRCPRLPNTSALLVGSVRGEDLVAALDLVGIAVSTGSACSTGSSRPSLSLLAMGLDVDVARSLVRVSLGRRTTAREVETAAAAIAEAAMRLRRHQPATGVSW